MKCIKVDCEREAVPESNYCKEHLDNIKLNNIENDTIAYLGLPNDFTPDKEVKIKIDFDNLPDDD